MDGLHIFLLLLQGLSSLSHDWLSRPALEVRVQPGDNITLYCDCRTSAGVYTVWYRSCSHENQPPLLLELNLAEMKHTADAKGVLNPLPRFHFVKNQSSETYDLLIKNITESDEGLYYCGTKESKVWDKDHITEGYVYSYGNIMTRVFLDSREPRSPMTQDCGVCWSLLFSLCPAAAVVFSLLSAVLVYQLCQKTAGEPKTDGRRADGRQNEDEEVCNTALDIRQTSQRLREWKTKHSDSSIYSTVKYSVLVEFKE